jgi:hypothetical protein
MTPLLKKEDFLASFNYLVIEDTRSQIFTK